MVKIDKDRLQVKSIPWLARSLELLPHKMRAAFNADTSERLLRRLREEPLGESALDLPLWNAWLMAGLPPDPLASQTPDPICLVVPTAGRDLPLLLRNLESTVRSSAHPIDSVYVISPESLQGEVCAQVSVLARSFDSINWCFLPDPRVLPQEVSQALDDIDLGQRRAWYAQQLLKWNAVLLARTDAALVVDADTRLVKPRTWVSSGVQVLTPAYENHLPYKRHIQRIWNGAIAPLRISFVAHHQLIQRHLLRTMLDSLGGQVMGQLAWLNAIDPREQSGASEYDTYATWTVRTFPELIHLARWGNQSLPRSASSYDLRDEPGWVMSRSFHWHTKDRRKTRFQ